jgi:toxin HigB-1
LPAKSGSDRWPMTRGLEVPSGGSQPIPSELDDRARSDAVQDGGPGAEKERKLGIDTHFGFSYVVEGCVLDLCKATPYNLDMIKSFRSKALRNFAAKGGASKLSVQNSDRVARILLSIDAATAPEQLNVPGFKFHALKGKDKGRFSVWVTGNYRVTFAWSGEDATDLDLEDYH